MELVHGMHNADSVGVNLAEVNVHVKISSLGA